ncbi:MAG: hypothetical protein ACC635_01760 [Acidiferrobacterales bacterium]
MTPFDYRDHTEYPWTTTWHPGLLENESRVYRAVEKKYRDI